MYSIFLAIFVPWSRMYLGSHSADQLLNGLLYSFGFLVLYRYYFRRQIFRLLKSLLSPNIQRKKLKYLVLASIHLLFIIPPLILYQINMNFRDIDMIQQQETYLLHFVMDFYYCQIGMETIRIQWTVERFCQDIGSSKITNFVIIF